MKKFIKNLNLYEFVILHCGFIAILYFLADIYFNYEKIGIFAFFTILPLFLVNIFYFVPKTCKWWLEK